MANLWQAIVDSFKYLWPFVIVHQWEVGLYTVFGRFVTPWRLVGFRRRALPKILGPGLYLRIPFFTQLREIGLTWDFMESGRLDITLRDGRELTCEVVAKLRVNDPVMAYFEFGDYPEDMRRALRAAVSEVLSEADSERFSQDRRVRLLGQSLLAGVRTAAARIGFEVEAVQVTTFILQPKIHRLLMDGKAPVPTPTE